MMKLSILASSSKGNCSLLSSGDTHILIDAGLSALRLRKGLEALGLHPKQIAAIFITHEHKDHCKGLGQFCKKVPQHIYCTRHTGAILREMTAHAQLSFIEPESTITLGDFKVSPFSVSHDAVDPVGYVFECSEGKRIAFVTDTGRILLPMKKHLQQLDALYLESNYDEEMLKQSGRPYSLISRIASHWGHLSNTQACELVAEIASPRLRNLILAHLSQDCNTPDCARAKMLATLQGAQITDCALHCAHPSQALSGLKI